jgi:adenylate cyclase
MTGYVAIVDDEEGIRDILQAFLQKEGYPVVTASNPAALLALAREKHIEAFIVDIEIRGEDGIELCRRIRALEAHERTPILCITGNDYPEVLLKAFNAGADDFIGKPMNLVSLLARLRVQLQKTDYFAKLERARQMMKRYLSPRVARLAEEYSETGTVPAPEERLVSICFTDIRGFTALSESMDPVQLFASLSGHLRLQIETVYRFGGYVDKFNGDGLMAVFDGPEMVEQCCLCALGIMEETTHSNIKTNDKFPIGIGIHTGRVVIGNIGSPEHLDHSAVGTNVNLAARLCGYAQPETIIVSDAVRDALPSNASIEFLEPREVQIRGVSGPVKIYRLTARKARIQ